MDTIACHLPTSDHMVYCHDETTGDTFLIIREIEIILKNNINSMSHQWIDLETDIHGWFVINSIFWNNNLSAKLQLNLQEGGRGLGQGIRKM